MKIIKNINKIENNVYYSLLKTFYTFLFCVFLYVFTFLLIPFTYLINCYELLVIQAFYCYDLLVGYLFTIKEFDCKYKKYGSIFANYM